MNGDNLLKVFGAGSAPHRVSSLLISALVHHTGITLCLSQAAKASLIPVPTPSLIMAASALLRPAQIGSLRTLVFLMRHIVLPSALGMTIGSMLPFWLAKQDGEDVFQRSKKLSKIRKKYLSSFEVRMRANSGAYLLVLRAAPFVPLTLGSLMAGVFDAPQSEFILWTFVGALVRCLILAFLGLLTRGTIDVLVLKIHRFSALTIFALAVTVLVTCLVSIFLKRAREREV